MAPYHGLETACLHRMVTLVRVGLYGERDGFECVECGALLGVK